QGVKPTYKKVKGFQPLQIEKSDCILFRVRVGRFNNTQEAENMSEKIKKFEGLQTFITLL
ncbi:MAG: SPOR domain-containing protein, partial [Thermodesulfovibrionales bacterium]